MGWRGTTDIWGSCARGERGRCFPRTPVRLRCAQASCRHLAAALAYCIVPHRQVCAVDSQAKGTGERGDGEIPLPPPRFRRWYSPIGSGRQDRLRPSVMEASPFDVASGDGVRGRPHGDGDGLHLPDQRRSRSMPGAREGKLDLELVPATGGAGGGFSFASLPGNLLKSQAAVGCLPHPSHARVGRNRTAIARDGRGSRHLSDVNSVHDLTGLARPKGHSRPG